ncbi:O-antigen ligase family protein [Halocalculus aciditolerans]|uniref:O-antigen ligase family protein n=1 Tax=Halocalculus aciditolerans TaxID=1383812 RepID=UPI001667C561|nr:O-antigen ligase family protein [Halocalculus aciditolerans]
MSEPNPIKVVRKLCSDTGKTDQFVRLTLALTIGIFIIVPTLTVALRFVIPQPLASLTSLGLVVGSYSLGAIYRQHTRQGIVAALLVFITISANVPLGTEEAILFSIGPQILLAQVPMVMAVFALWHKFERVSVSTVVFLLGISVWPIISAPVIPGPRPTMAVYYGIYLAQAAVTYYIFHQSIISKIITIEEFIQSTLVVVFGHIIFSIMQLINSQPIGLSYLGESTRGTIATITQFGVTVQIGPYISGLAGGGALTVLLVSTLPAAIILGVVKTDLRWMLVAIASTAIIRMTAWDSAKGGALIGLTVTLLIIIHYGYYKKREYIQGAFVTVILSVGVLLLSARRTISKRSAATQNKNENPTNSTVGQKQPETHGTSAGSTPEWQRKFLQGEWSNKINANIPIFDTSNLSPRIHQYISGIDLALQYPVTGIGGANYYYISSQVDGKERVMHNITIAILAETGIIGLLLWGGLFLTSIKQGLNTIIQTSDTTKSYTLLAIIAGLISTLAQLQFSPHLISHTALFPLMAMLGALAGTGRRD